MAMTATTTTTATAPAALGSRPNNTTAASAGMGRLLHVEEKEDCRAGSCSSSSSRNPPDSVPAASVRRLAFDAALAPAKMAPTTTSSSSSSSSPVAIPPCREAPVTLCRSGADPASPQQPQQQPQPPQDPALVRVLNFNVFAGSPLPFYQNYTSTQSLEDSRRLHLQIEKIQALAPDIVCLQEVCSDGVQRCVA